MCACLPRAHSWRVPIHKGSSGRPPLWSSLAQGWTWSQQTVPLALIVESALTVKHSNHSGLTHLMEHNNKLVHLYTCKSCCFTDIFRPWILVFDMLQLFSVKDFHKQESYSYTAKLGFTSCTRFKKKTSCKVVQQHIIWCFISSIVLFFQNEYISNFDSCNTYQKKKKIGTAKHLPLYNIAIPSHNI